MNEEFARLRVDRMLTVMSGFMSDAINRGIRNVTELYEAVIEKLEKKVNTMDIRLRIFEGE
jgi:hypothetical protein